MDSTAAIPENKHAVEHPLTIVQNGVSTTPTILGESLILDSQNVSSVWLNTLNYLYVKSLSIRNNPLTFLADVYTLRNLDCSNCKLKALPGYMPALTTLNCDNNIITRIPNYKNLVRLSCANNIITKLPILPSLKSLIINNNPIIEVNILTLTYLEAQGCPILFLYDIPGLVRRSSTLERNGSFKWITTRTEKINSKLILIDWTKCKTHPAFTKILSKSKFWSKVFKYLLV